VSDTRTLFWSMNISFWPPTATTMTPCRTFDHPDHEIMRTELWYSSYDRYQVVMAQLRRARTSDHTMTLHYWMFNSRTTVYLSHLFIGQCTHTMYVCITGLFNEGKTVEEACGSMTHRVWTFVGDNSKAIDGISIVSCHLAGCMMYVLCVE
jgi:hypothetical protein